MNKYFSTEVGLLSIWNSDSFSDVVTMDQYLAHFVDEDDMISLMKDGKIVVWGTGGDGSFAIEVRYDPLADLHPEEEKIVVSKALDHKLVVTEGGVCIGSPECVGGTEADCITKDICEKIDSVKPGTYTVNVYFLVSAEDSEGTVDEKFGFIIALHPVLEDHVFPEITAFPQLG